MDAASHRASQARRNGGNFGRTRVESVVYVSTYVRYVDDTYVQYLLYLRLSRVKHNASARRAGERQSRSSAGFLNFWWRFFGSSERPPGGSLKIRKPTKWPSGGGAFSDQGERKLTGGSVSNAFPPSDGLTKRRKCGSAAATSSGFARVQDRAATW